VTPGVMFPVMSLYLVLPASALLFVIDPMSGLVCMV